MDKNTLDKINKFTRRTFSGDELFVFPVVLCDNDIDRDHERFSDEALETLSKLFVGKTGIFDHSPTASNQNARIFDTEVITDNDRLTAYGKPYKYLKAHAYMIRTENNKDLIDEIDGGIKKEVSISCSTGKKICSVCGCDVNRAACSHKKGRKYSGTMCHTILDDIKDAYEWSFVAVPAQVNAGVTKKFSENIREKTAPDINIPEAEELKREIHRLAYFTGGRKAALEADAAAKSMTVQQLSELKKTYERTGRYEKIEIQLMPDKNKMSESEFKI